MRGRNQGAYERAWLLRCGVLGLAAFALLAASGCGSVAVYERGKLAHFTMRPSDASSVGQAHVYAIHEGAMGGTVGATTGCGCN